MITITHSFYNIFLNTVYMSILFSLFNGPIDGMYPYKPSRSRTSSSLPLAHPVDSKG